LAGLSWRDCLGQQTQSIKKSSRCTPSGLFSTRGPETQYNFILYRVPNRPSGDFGVVKGLRPITQPREPRRDCPRSKHRDRVPEFKKRERTVGARTKVCARGEVATGGGGVVTPVPKKSRKWVGRLCRYRRTVRRAVKAASEEDARTRAARAKKATRSPNPPPPKTKLSGKV